MCAALASDHRVPIGAARLARMERHRLESKVSCTTGSAEKIIKKLFSTAFAGRSIGWKR
jgi:hypothetical protein